MGVRQKELTRTVVVRLDEDLYEALRKDAEDNERTISQTIRHKLRELMSGDGDG